MKSNQIKKNLAAFEAQALTAEQQLKVKGGDGGQKSSYVGVEDEVIM